MPAPTSLPPEIVEGVAKALARAIAKTIREQDEAAAAADTEQSRHAHDDAASLLKKDATRVGQ